MKGERETPSVNSKKSSSCALVIRAKRSHCSIKPPCLKDCEDWGQRFIHRRGLKQLSGVGNRRTEDDPTEGVTQTGGTASSLGIFGQVGENEVNRVGHLYRV